MRLLVVGGSGYVAGLVLPLLAEQFALRVYDRVPPRNPVWEYVAGDVTDAAALQGAAEQMDLLLYMAMGRGPQGGVMAPAAAYDVNVKGLHYALDAAKKAGIRRAVYTSSLSVYDGHDLVNGRYDQETVPPEPHSV